MKSHLVTHQVKSLIWELDLADKVSSSSIVEAILDYKQTCPQSRSSSIYAWHSNYDLYVKTDRLNPLLTVIENEVNIIANKVNHYAKIVECWAAIYNKHDFTVWHNHDISHYSTVYYAQADESASSIVFQGNIEIKPKSGMLLVFPGYLDHMVPRCISNNQRIIVASNLFLFRDKI